MMMTWTDPVSGKEITVLACQRGPKESQILDDKWEREIHAADPEGSEWGA